MAHHTKEQLAKLQHGAHVTVRLDDGSEVRGRFDGVSEKGHVLLSGPDAGAGVPIDQVKLVAMDVSSEGPE